MTVAELPSLPEGQRIRWTWPCGHEVEGVVTVSLPNRVRILRDDGQESEACPAEEDDDGLLEFAEGVEAVGADEPLVIGPA